MNKIDTNLILWNVLLKLVRLEGFSDALLANFPEIEPFRANMPNFASKLHEMVAVIRPRRTALVAWIDAWADSHPEGKTIIEEMWKAKFPPATPVPMTGPSLFQKAKNLGGAVARVADAAIHHQPIRVTDQEKEARMTVCRGCEFFNATKGTCLKCGCVTRFKTALATEHCPVGKW